MTKGITISQFEEKTFEEYSNVELLIGKSVMFPPGQRAERWFGFDNAFFLPFHPFLEPSWKMRSRLGRRLGDIIWLKDEFNSLPPFKFNLFIQYKRPEYVHTELAGEYKYWNRDYYRFALTDHQHRTLRKLSTEVKSDAVVAYCSSVFWKNETLWSFHENRSIIANSNFAEVSKIQEDHHIITYTDPGFTCRGHSEVELIQSCDIFELNYGNEKVDNFEIWYKLVSQLSNMMDYPNTDKNLMDRIILSGRYLEKNNINWLIRS